MSRFRLAAGPATSGTPDASDPSFLRDPVQRRRGAVRDRRGGGRLLLLEVQPGPARPRRARQLRAAGDDPRPRGRRLAAGRICPRAPALPADPGDAEDRGRGLPVGRGQELLQARRHRPRGDRARLPDQRQVGQAPGRLDHHPAGRQELPAVRRADLRPQDQGGAAGAADRGGLLQGQDPGALPQRDLPGHHRPGPQPARRGGGGARLFRQVGPRADHQRGGLPRRPAEGAEQLPPLPQDAGGPRPPQRDHPPDGGEQLHHQGRGGGRQEDAARGQPAGRLPERRQRQLLHRGGPPRDLRALRREEALRGRPLGARHPRSEDAGPAPARRWSTASCATTRPMAGAVRSPRST